MALSVQFVACWLAFTTLAFPLAATGAAPATQPGVSSSQPARDMTAGYKLDRGPQKVAMVDLVLHDKARNKDLPVKVRYPTDPGGPVPVVIFSHGAGGSGDAFPDLTEHWASHGYAVMLPTHSDSIKLRRQQGEDIRDLRDEMRNIVRKVQPMDRLADVKFIIDSLDQIEAKLTDLKGPGGKEKLDRDRIGNGGPLSRGADDTDGLRREDPHPAAGPADQPGR